MWQDLRARIVARQAGPAAVTAPAAFRYRGLWRALAGAMLVAVAALAHAAAPIQHWTTDTGARVLLVESPGLPMLDVQVDFDAGSRHDPPDQAGLAHLTASLVDAGLQAAEGQPALDENAVAEAWADLGAQFGARATSDRMSFQLRTLTDPTILPKAVALAARQIAHPAYPAQVLARDIARLSAAWREGQTRPGTLAQQRFDERVYGGHPYGWTPRPQTYERIGRDDLLAFHQRHLHAGRAVVTLVGAVDRAQADAIARQLTAGLPRGGAAPVVAKVSDLPAAVDERVSFSSSQAHLLMGQPGIRRGDPDFFPLFVGNHILGGGGFVSRLTHEVREQRGLAYSVYSYFAPGLHRGAFTIGLQTRADQSAQALQVVRDTLARFVEEGPTEDELRAAQANLVGGFALRIDSNRKLLDHVAMIGFYDLPLDYLDTWPERVQAVSVAQVREAFQRRVQPQRMVTVVVGGAAP